MSLTKHQDKRGWKNKTLYHPAAGIGVQILLGKSWFTRVDAT